MRDSAPSRAHRAHIELAASGKHIEMSRLPRHYIEFAAGEHIDKTSAEINSADFYFYGEKLLESI